MKPEGTLLLKRSDIAALLNVEECMTAVEQAFRLYAEGQTAPPGVLGIHAADGGFHIKAGLLQLDRSYFAAKTNANFPQNMKRFGLPLIQGSIVLCDVHGVEPDAVTVDALCRLQLGARRHGCEIRLRRASAQLLELVAFMGLTAVLPD